MRLLALNLLLAALWVALGGRSLLMGFVLGTAAIALARPVVRSDDYLRAMGGVLLLVAVFLYELLKASLRLARDILRRRLPFRPGFLVLEVRDLDAAHAVLLANLISMTPGTVTVDSDATARFLVVHSLYVAEPNAARRDLERFADLVRRASRESTPRQG